MLPEGMAARLVELLLHGFLDDVMMPQLVSFETTSGQQTEMLGQISVCSMGRGFMLHVSNDFPLALEMEHGYQIANSFHMQWQIWDNLGIYVFRFQACEYRPVFKCSGSCIVSPRRVNVVYTPETNITSENPNF